MSRSSCSRALLLVLGCTSLLPSLELLAEPVEACLPENSIAVDPSVELAEALGAKREEAVGPVGADLDEALGQDAQGPRDARLVDVERVGDLVRGWLARARGLDHRQAGGRVLG